MKKPFKTLSRIITFFSISCLFNISTKWSKKKVYSFYIGQGIEKKVFSENKKE